MNDITKLYERVASLETTQLDIREEQKEVRKSLKEQVSILREIRDELSLYRTAIKLIKVVGLTIAFVLAFKFGDIKALWKGL